MSIYQPDLALVEALGGGATGGASMPKNAVVSSQQKANFEGHLQSGETAGTQEIREVVNNVEEGFNRNQLDIVKSLKNFEATGSAVELMVASHQGANRSVMVQLCGTVSKKCADNTEQLYKQQ